MNILSLTGYQIGHNKKRLAKYSGEIPEGCVGLTKDNYFVFLNTEEEFYSTEEKCIEILKPLKVKSFKNKRTGKSISSKEIFPTTLESFDFDDRLFIPMRANKPLDGIFSEEEGLLPATNYIIVGDPGIGKTTLIVQYAAQIQQQGYKTLFFSAEMSPRDLFKYSKRTPEITNVDTIFFSELFNNEDEEVDVWEMLENHIIGKGYNLVVLDSLAEILESVKDQKGWQKSLCEKRFVDLMIKANKKFLTSFLVIQQVTKGGNFVGSNKLKHNTTGMIELRFEGKQDTERYARVLKNRAGFKYPKIGFEFIETGILWKTELLELQAKVQLIKNLDREDDSEFAVLIKELKHKEEELEEIASLIGEENLI